MSKHTLSISEHTLSISEAQKELTRLPDQLAEGPNTVTVTRYSKPVLAILPFNTYKSMLETIESLQEALETLQETLEILRDEELMETFRESVKALQRGETVAWEDAKKELGLP